MPFIFLTLNPCAAHSPILQLFYGNTSVDLGARYPILVSSTERAILLSHDPVAAYDFFQFSIEAIFQHLFGWNYKNCDSSSEGGILGHLQAWTGTAELTEHANFHGHFSIWLLGGLNPSEINSKLAKHDDFERHFFAFFESISWHHFPDVDYVHDPQFEPPIQRPPDIVSPNALLGAYMHLTLDTSLIYFKIRSNHSDSYQNLQNTQKYFP